SSSPIRRSGSARWDRSFSVEGLRAWSGSTSRSRRVERLDGRGERDMRPVEIQTGVNIYAEGSALIKIGNTHVICTARLGDRVPPFLRDTNQGWITCEYGMLPRATDQRMQREATKGRASGRTQEIQRLIGRSLRAVSDLKAIGSRTLWIDCDVVQADGGTRT